MFLCKSSRRYKDKTYTNYMLVESVHTPKGPRQKMVCSLGDLSPRPAKEWLEEVHRQPSPRNPFQKKSTIVLPTDSGAILKIRKGSTPEAEQVELYRLLDVPTELIRPKKTRIYLPTNEGRHSD